MCPYQFYTKTYYSAHSNTTHANDTTHKFYTRTYYSIPGHIILHIRILLTQTIVHSRAPSSSVPSSVSIASSMSSRDEYSAQKRKKSVSNPFSYLRRLGHVLPCCVLSRNDRKGTRKRQEARDDGQREAAAERRGRGGDRQRPLCRRLMIWRCTRP